MGVLVVPILRRMERRLQGPYEVILLIQLGSRCHARFPRFLDDGLEKTPPRASQIATTGNIERSRCLPLGAQVWIGPERYGKFNLLHSQVARAHRVERGLIDRRAVRDIARIDPPARFSVRVFQPAGDQARNVDAANLTADDPSPRIATAWAPGARRGSRRSRAGSCGRASPPRRISPGAGRDGISNPRDLRAAPA